ncbi:restriction endonuclease subunit S [Prevotella melaninogenica]|uniref:Type I restriction system specificity protein n=1 Tax=Prevotella melaninogenica TaxID=28132 RepID=A0A250KJ75_9BACT|nr:restriction endonuclease subunit S [Prevotella melaninogenica]BBA29662.1 type I restriction system specificity protein [Prevotella melaninogenica]
MKNKEQHIFPFLERLLDGAEVEWKKLGEVAEISSGNSAPQHDEFFLGGEYPFCRTSDVGKVHHSINFYQIKDKLNEKGIKGLRLFKKETILLPKSGVSTLLNHRVMLSIDSYVSSHLATIYRKENKALSRYLFYFLSQLDICDLIPDKSYPSLKISQIANIRIPVPPLYVQEEIVRILDKFTTLEAELEAELDCRKRQYEYYRNQLLSFDMLNRGGQRLNNVSIMALGEVGEFIRGKRFVKTDITTQGCPCIHYGEMYTYYGIWANKSKSFISQTLVNKKNLRQALTNDVIIVGAGETIEDLGVGTAWLSQTPVVIHDACFIFRSSLNPKYVAYFTRTNNFHDQLRRHVSSGKISAVNAKGLSKIKIPVPPLSEQERIVSILDKFDTLVNSISEGLPKEIELRRKQYEYYREQLLSFRH